jgi:hypothetical protein
MCDCKETNQARGRQQGCCCQKDQNCCCCGDDTSAGSDCDCGCGCGCGCGSSCSSQSGCCSSGGCECGKGGFRRRFKNKAELIAEIESYLSELKAEVQGVEERLQELRG